LINIIIIIIIAARETTMIEFTIEIVCPFEDVGLGDIMTGQVEADSHEAVVEDLTTEPDCPCVGEIGCGDPNGQAEDGCQQPNVESENSSPKHAPTPSKLKRFFTKLRINKKVGR
jgi:hypothetical protein